MTKPAHSPGEVFRRRLRDARKRKGWEQQDLADRLAEMGYDELNRVTISRIEAGRPPRKVTVDDLLAIAAALNVAPVHLLAPLEDDAVVAVADNLKVPAPMLRAWVRGAVSLERDERSWFEFLREMPTAELEQKFYEYLQRGLSPLQAGLTADKTREQAGDLAWEFQVGEEIREAEQKKERDDGK